MIDNLAELIKNKRIAIVAHARWLLDLQAGAQIEYHDIIIRMNYGLPMPKNYTAIGRRTDIWMYGNAEPPVELQNQFKPRLTIIINEVGRKRYGLNGNVLDYPRNLHSKITEELGAIGGQKPSTGCLAIMLMLAAGGFSELNLYGFDFCATEDWTNGYTRSPDDQPPHDFYVEEFYLLDKINKNKNVSWFVGYEIERK